MKVTNFFKKVVVDVTSNRVAFEVKINVHVLAKTARVVISLSFSIAKSFQNAVRL